ncbi:MAG: phytanoyl-CoA dioxygenase family protein [Solirubrobacteraceae bacterium]
MLKRAASQLRYRRALTRMAAPGTPDPRYFSRFDGLWTDRRDAEEELQRRVDSGRLSPALAAQLHHWIRQGYVVIREAADPAVCERLRTDLDEAFRGGDERLLTHSPASTEYQPLRPGMDTERARVVDVYAYYDSARQALLSPRIVEFLSTVFDDDPLLFQSLTFERGSQQPMHQDTAFVVVSSPLELAAAWIALEDIHPGSGELMYLEGSHRLPEFLFSGRYKHWNPKRDGQQQHDEWQRLIHENARLMGLKHQTFLPRQGDALIWSADLAHGGSELSDPGLTRRSLVGHYCPSRVQPIYFALEPRRRAKVELDGGDYASQHYAITPNG